MEVIVVECAYVRARGAVINLIHSKIFRPENGWDPISSEYAETYARREWMKGDEINRTIDYIGSFLGSFDGKKILDLGAGPGQYSIAFAKRGADVTWYDISENYMHYAKAMEEDCGSRIEYKIGYMDEALRNVSRKYDLVFNRICWYYCISDIALSQAIFSLIKPGGWGYIDAPSARSRELDQGTISKCQRFLYRHCSIKMGHPYPPKGRVVSLFAKLPIKTLSVRCSTSSELIVFQKSS